MTREERKKEVREKRTKSLIVATKELLQTESFRDVSIRKIADRAGVHNSTIYLYFPDADKLIALASVHQFQKYSVKLSEISRSVHNSYDTFFDIWKSSCDCFFSKADIFFNFFFGKYGDDITEIMNDYYDLFPEERLKYSDYIESMYYGRNISDRCLRLMESLVGLSDVKISKDNIELINEVVVYSFKGFLYKARANSSISSEKLTEDFMKILHFLVDA